MKTILQHTAIFWDAFLILWKSKFLVFFGLFLGGLSVLYENGFNPNQYESTEILEQNLRQYMENIFIFVQNNPQETILIAAEVAAIIFILFLLEVFSLSAIIRSVHASQKKICISFKKSLFLSKAIFRKMLLLRLLFLAIFSGVILILTAPILLIISYTNNSGLSAITSIIAGILLLYLLIVITYTRKYAQIYLATSKLSIPSAIEAGYLLFIKNDMSSIGIFIVISIIRSVFLVAVGLVSLFLLGITFANAQPFWQLFDPNTWNTLPVKSIATLSVFFLMHILAQSAWEAYNHTVWVLFFEKIAKHPETLETEKVSEKNSLERKAFSEAPTGDTSEIR